MTHKWYESETPVVNGFAATIPDTVLRMSRPTRPLDGRHLTSPPFFYWAMTEAVHSAPELDVIEADGPVTAFGSNLIQQ